MAARAAFRADYVPLVPLSMPVSCPLCRVPRRFRAARPAFHADFVPLVPFVPLKLRSLAARAAPPCRWRCVSRRFRDARAVRALFYILSCFAPKPLLHVILMCTKAVKQALIISDTNSYTLDAFLIMHEKSSE